MAASALALLVAATAASQQRSDKEWAGMAGDVEIASFARARFFKQSGKWVEDHHSTIALDLYDRRGNKIREFYYTDDGNLRDKVVAEYDDKGRMTYLTVYIGDDLLAKTYFEYDDRGNNIKQTSYDGNGTVTIKASAAFNDKGNAVEVLSSIVGGPSERLVFKYNAVGEITELVKFINKKLEHRIIYNCEGGDTDAGRAMIRIMPKIQPGYLSTKALYFGFLYRIPNMASGLGPDRAAACEMVAYNSDGAVTVKWVSNYDPKENRSETVIYKGDGTLEGKAAHTYDDKGNLTTVTVFSAKGSEETREGFAYEYDSVGNWTKATKSILVTKGSKSYFEPKEAIYRYIGYHKKDLDGSGVDKKPVAKNRPMPRYTERALQNKVEGTVSLRVLIGSDGLVKQAKVTKGLPDGLDDQAIKAVFKIKFDPAMKDGQPVATWVNVEVGFTIK